MPVRKRKTTSVRRRTVSSPAKRTSSVRRKRRGLSNPFTPSQLKNTSKAALKAGAGGAAAVADGSCVGIPENRHPHAGPISRTVGAGDGDRHTGVVVRRRPAGNGVEAVGCLQTHHRSTVTRQPMVRPDLRQ